MDRLERILPAAVASIGTDIPPDEPWICPQCGIIPPLRLPSGRYIRRSCECERSARREILLAEQRRAWIAQQAGQTFAWLGGRFHDLDLRGKTFETFERTSDPGACNEQGTPCPQWREEAFQATRSFVLMLEGSLILHGSYGTGKTHLLSAICHELWQCGTTCRFATAPKLFKAIQDCIQHHEDTYRIIRQAITTPLLLLDDVDKAKPSEFREEIYFEIIDERTKAGKPIALSTNQLDDLAYYIGGAACSRLSMGQIAVEMRGTDYRLSL